MPSQADCDISVVMPIHDVGILAHRTVRSLIASIEHATNAGISCEFIVVQDRPSPETVEYFEKQKLYEFRLARVDHGDVGASRNTGAKMARGKYIFYLDSDDLVSANWLTKAFRYAENGDTSPIVLHPRYTVLFEKAWCIQDRFSSDDKNFDWRTLVEGNLWHSSIFVNRELAREIPFANTAPTTGFGYDDWHWYTAVLDRGVPVHVVDETAAFVRRREFGSLLLSQHANQSVLPTTPYLSPQSVKARSDLTKVPKRKKSIRRTTEKFMRWFAGVVGKYYPRGRGLVRFLDQVQQKLFARRNQVRRIPEVLTDLWKEIHDIEPQLYPDSWSLWRYSWATVPYPEVGESYVELCKSWNSNVSHVFLVPAVRSGGAALVLLNLVKALVQHQLSDGITVIATSDVDSSWKTRLPESVNFIEFGKMFRKLLQHQKENLLATLIVQSQPSVVHNINSLEGYQVFRKYGKALKQHSRLFASVFAESVSDSGREFGYPLDDLPYCYEYLEGIFTDNRRFVEKLCRLFAFEAERFHVSYQPVQPVSIQDRSRSEANRGNLKVLWASRLDREKRPDVLLKIAQRCADMSIHFHVFGRAVLGKDRITRQLKRLRNVTCHGPFDGFASIHPEQFDLFLYTSQSDGIPNVVLEAMAARLPVIASDVGGLKEVITHSETGWLVSPFDDVEQFAEVLQRVGSDRDQLNQIAEFGQQKVSSQHSWEQFADSLQQVKAYLDKPENRSED